MSTATSVLVLGQPGTGKTTSLSMLDPKETAIINVIGKTLPFRSGAKNYVKLSSKDLTGNYICSDDYALITQVITHINDKRPDIKNIVIDDFQYIMGNEFLSRCLEKGYEKFAQIGNHAFKVIDLMRKCRGDIVFFALWHTQEENGVHKAKTCGKMLDDTISLDGVFDIILHAVVNQGTYSFLTQHNGTHVARSWSGLFETTKIDNNLSFVRKKINEYLLGE